MEKTKSYYSLKEWNAMPKETRDEILLSELPKTILLMEAMTSHPQPQQEKMAKLLREMPLDQVSRLTVIEEDGFLQLNMDVHVTPEFDKPIRDLIEEINESEDK